MMLFATDPSVTANPFLLILLAIIGAGGATGITGFLNRRKVNRDVESVAVDTATGLIKVLRDEISRKDQDHADQMRELRDEIVTLTVRLDFAEKKAVIAEARADRTRDQGLVMADRLEGVQADLLRYKQRVAQLEQALIAGGIGVPPWE